MRFHHFIHFLSVHGALCNFFVFFLNVLNRCVSKYFQWIFKWRLHAKLLYLVIDVWFCTYKLSSFKVKVLFISKSRNFENRMHLYLFAQLSVESEILLIIIDVNILMKLISFIIYIRNNTHHCVFFSKLI